MIKKENIKKYTGAVNVNGDITPITREKIEQVEPDKWQKMDVSDLVDQKRILTNRYFLALQSGHGDVALQIKNGINIIENILYEKEYGKDDFEF